MKKIELLAPAKNYEFGINAIKCGADAVYIGAASFGARAAVGNSISDIEKLVNYAHFYGAKVYVTINTILSDSEILEAQTLIQNLYNIGVDAVIIQDMGLLELDLPIIPLFASTQCHNNSIEKVKFLEKVGFQRVILARELSLNQISQIRKNTSVELESFIHGALCVCYSGQCYLSYAIGGRSGNRGECAQPCRKKYSLIDEKGKIISKESHLLSLKDMNRYEYIEELINAGITSLKIEGRLKDINYVKNIVSFYRQKLDLMIEGGDIFPVSSGKTIINFSPNPHKTFNREYTDYFLNERSKNIASFKTPRFMGESLGVVKEVFKDSFILENSKMILNNADGISYFNNDGNIYGTQINKVVGNKIFPNNMKNIKKGVIIYRNSDQKFLKKIESASIFRKIGVSFLIKFDKEGVFVQAKDEDLNFINEFISKEFEKAHNKEKALESITKQFSKLGETDFYLQDIEIIGENITFIPVSEINTIRRSIVDKLTEERKKNYKRKIFVIEKNSYPFPEKNLGFEGNVINKYAEMFYKRHCVEKIQPAAECASDMTDKKVMTTKFCLKYQFNLCSKSEKTSLKLFLIDEKNKKYRLNFDCSKCVMEVYY